MQEKWFWKKWTFKENISSYSCMEICIQTRNCDEECFFLQTIHVWPHDWDRSPPKWWITILTSFFSETVCRFICSILLKKYLKAILKTKTSFYGIRNWNRCDSTWSKLWINKVVCNSFERLCVKREGDDFKVDLVQEVPIELRLFGKWCHDIRVVEDWTSRCVLRKENCWRKYGIMFLFENYPLSFEIINDKRNETVQECLYSRGTIEFQYESGFWQEH
jgi:hypothetical protein